MNRMDLSRGLGGVHTVTWFDTGVGLREMLVRSESDAAQVKAVLQARGYELTACGNLLPSEVAQVLVLPIFRPRQWVPLEQEEGDEGDEGEMVAMVQLVRPFGSPPFTDDDTYLAELLAPHLAHALSRTQAVDASRVKSGQYQHILRTAQTMGSAADQTGANSEQVGTEPEISRSVSAPLASTRRLSLEGEISPGSGALKLQLAPTALATSSYGIDTVRGAMRRLFACDEVLVYMPRDPAAVLTACERATLQRSGGTAQQLASFDKASSRQLAANGNKAGGDPSSREMVPLRLEERNPRTKLASVSGMEELCISGEPLVLVAPGEGQRKPSRGHQNAADRTFARNLDAVGRSTRTPVRSMLCVPALLHRDAVEEVLGDSVGTYLSGARIEGDPDPLVPCLLQWVNRHDAPFTPADKKSAAMLAQLVSRAGQVQTQR